MNKKILKLIKEYAYKITCSDLLLKAAEKEKRKARDKNGRSSEDFADWHQQIKILNAAKQTQVQAKSDLESLID